MGRTTYLHSFQALLPSFHLAQEKLISWTLNIHEAYQKSVSPMGVDKDELIRYCLRPSQIAERYFECPDVNENWDEHQIYHINENTPNGADLFERNKFYSAKAEIVFKEFYPDHHELPEHLIHVTCTGYTSPSPAQKVFNSLSRQPAITHAYHMGCYASLPAIRMGRAFISEGEYKSVDIVHTEMCSLHLDPSHHSPEQLVIQTLFADGHINYRLESAPKGRSFKVLAIHEMLLRDSTDDMTWIPGPHSIQMSLAKEVPGKIREHLEEFIHTLCLKAEGSWSRLRTNGIMAIHPGGPKIIDSIQRLLDLTDYQVQASRKVLKERGNMSSATLPHVWKDILEDDIPKGTEVLSLAFGPGLTIYGAIFELVDE